MIYCEKASLKPRNKSRCFPISIERAGRRAAGHAPLASLSLVALIVTSLCLVCPPPRVHTMRPLLSPPLVSVCWLRCLMQHFLHLLPIDVHCLRLYSLVCLLVGEWPYFPLFYKFPDTEASSCNTSSLKLLSWPWRGGLSRRLLPSLAGAHTLCPLFE